ncbi:MAG: crotonase/enoyl-CoA hydratase family protein [Pseudomonadales bacterium]|nr:crotonase/enoyl-CoA hydratase family protein [Pseudomonadales bacterium]
MNYSCFDVSIANDVAHIVLNRPDKRNSMIHEFWDELPTIVQNIDQNSTARVIVLSSTGPHFTSGLDTSIFGSSVESSDNPEDAEKSKRQRGAKLYDTIKHMQKSFTCLEQCRIPVIAAIQGGAIGGGVDLVTACDLRYMTEDGFLSIYEINIGMTADVGTFPRITRLLPEGVVKELAYTGRRITAQEAKQHGLVNEIYTDHEAMLEATMGIARQIATKAPLAVYGSKKIINHSRDHSTADSLDYISLWNASMLQPDEISEAFAAAQEEREGDFVDLPTARRKMGTGINE